MRNTKLISTRSEISEANLQANSATAVRLWSRGPARVFFVFGVLVAVMSAGVGSSQAQSSTQEWSAPSRAARKVNPVPAEPAEIAKGKDLFVAACLPCHGASGRGDGPSAGTLERNGVRVRPGNLSDPKMWLQSDGAIFWKISEGNTPMPAFQETFTEDQRWHVVNYVRTLAPPLPNSTQITKSSLPNNK